MIAVLRAKFPGIVSSKSDDICYATTNRQIAVKQLARECELVLVIGSTNSSADGALGAHTIERPFCIFLSVC